MLLMIFQLLIKKKGYQKGDPNIFLQQTLEYASSTF
jgi:hypothetical protein